MTIDAPEAIRAELQPGERLVWSGRPATGLRLRAVDAKLIPFSLLWGGFSFFWEWNVLHSGAPVHMALFGIPFVLVGLYLIVGRFFVDAWKRARTAYTLTTERAIIVTGSVRSIPLHSLGEITLREGRGGSGTILLGPGSQDRLGLAGWPGAERYAPPAFEMIDDAREVYARIQSLQRSATKA